MFAVKNIHKHIFAITSSEHTMSTIAKPVSVKAVRSLSAKAPTLSKAGKNLRERMAAVRRSSSATEINMSNTLTPLVAVETLPPNEPPAGKYLSLTQQQLFVNTAHIVDIHKNTRYCSSSCPPRGPDEAWIINTINEKSIVVLNEKHPYDFKKSIRMGGPELLLT
jgi:hypothetical protein